MPENDHPGNTAKTVQDSAGDDSGTSFGLNKHIVTASGACIKGYIDAPPLRLSPPLQTSNLQFRTEYCDIYNNGARKDTNMDRPGQGERLRQPYLW